MSLSRDNAISVLRAYDDAFDDLVTLTQWKSSTPGSPTRTYTAVYTDAQNTLYSLIISASTTHALDTHYNLLETVASHTSLPVPRLLKRDDSGTLISSPYTLSLHPTGTLLSSSALTDRTRTTAELRLGTHLRTLHTLQNDWFGIPGERDDWGEFYSWQEAFTLLLETALEDFEQRDPECVGEIPVVDLRRALGRAIGFYLFDDVEVPSLVWCGERKWDERVYVAVDGLNAGEITDIVGWEDALWGDPLMEGALRAPSVPLLEGYGGSPIIFARQRTKRMWYTTYAALRALLAAVDAGDVEREAEARAVLTQVSKELQDAPCY